MAANSQGIQTLLEAEKEAAKIVAKARQYRVQRLKDAKVEAWKEIEAMKAQKENEFLQFQQKNTQSDLVQTVQRETEEKLAQVQASYRQNKDTVVTKLLQTIGRVESAVHPNAMLQ